MLQNDFLLDKKRHTFKITGGAKGTLKSNQFSVKNGPHQQPVLFIAIQISLCQHRITGMSNHPAIPQTGFHHHTHIRTLCKPNVFFLSSFAPFIQ